MLEAPAEPSAIERRRKAQIMRAVIDVVSEEGIEGATMRRIAERANVSTGMLTYYYRSKNDLIKDTIHSAYGRFTGGLDAEAGQAFGPERILQFFRRISDDGSFPPTFWLDYWSHAARDPSLKNPLDRREPPRARELFRLCIEGGVRSGELRPDLDVELAADVINLAYYGARVQLGIQDMSEERIRGAIDYAIRLMKRE